MLYIDAYNIGYYKITLKAEIDISIQTEMKKSIRKLMYGSQKQKIDMLYNLNVLFFELNFLEII